MSGDELAAIAGAVRDGDNTGAAVDRALRASPHRGTVLALASVGDAAVGTATTDHGPPASLAESPGWAAAVHGVIDNTADLAAELGVEDDPAVVALAVVRSDGAAGISRLRGAFALLVTDGTALIAARDHLGSKPLHYRHDAAGFTAATEAKQVLAACELSPQPDFETVTAIFYGGGSPHASLAGVDRVPRASTLEHRQGRLPVTRRHWNPELETSDLGTSEAIDRLERLLEEVIRRTVTGADAVSLSGGLDSSAVAAFASAPHLELGAPLAAFTVVYPHHPTVDELGYTQQIATHLEIPLETMEHRAGPLDDIETWVTLADGAWDTLPASVVAESYRTAADLGARTVLTGEFAELAMTMRSGLLGHLLTRGRFGALRHQLEARRAEGRSWSGLARQVGREIMPAPLGHVWARLTRRTGTYLPRWVDVESLGGNRYRTDILTPVLSRWLNAQLGVTIAANTAVEVDELAADRAGVTVRRPLADRDVWDFFLSLRAEVKFPDATYKRLLREAIRSRLPAAIVDRTDKTAFDAYAEDTAPWAELERLIDPRVFRMRGVDYGKLSRAISDRDLPVLELEWAINLARAHAFVRSLS